MEGGREGYGVIVTTSCMVRKAWREGGREGGVWGHSHYKLQGKEGMEAEGGVWG